MTEDDDIDGLAAEYVLGSLDLAERRQVDARRQTDASLAAAVAAWERRLAPLSERGRDAAPPGILTLKRKAPAPGEAAPVQEEPLAKGFGSLSVVKAASP